MAAGDLVFDHITSFLKLEDDPNGKKLFILAIKDSLSDLNFVFADFLLHNIKRDNPVVLVNFAQSFHHYSQIMSKSGINLKALRENKKIISVDVLSEAEAAIKDSECFENLSCLRSILLDPSNNDCLRPLFESIKTAVETAVMSEPEQFFLLIDEINVLIYLGVSFKALHKFIQDCYSYCIRVSKIPGMLCVGSVLDENDEESMRQVNYLSQICDINILVEGLKTGYSKDIQGKITFNSHKSCSIPTKQKFFFKVEDKGSKFFADGL